jgi:signal peptidase I
MSSPFPRRAVAVLLSCLGPGLGQLYLGRNARGFALLVLGLLFVPIAIVVANAGPSPTALFLLLASSIVTVLAVVAGVVDAAIPNAEDGLRPPASPRALAVGIGALVAVGIVVGIGGSLWIRGSLLEAFKVASDSMTPTLHTGDRVLVGKRTPWNRPLARGDIVVYRPPGVDRAYVKRVVGLPGETIRMRGTAALVDGTPIADLAPAGPGRLVGVERFGEGDEVAVEAAEGAVPGEPVLVPPGSCFVLGDRRADSKDSRSQGPVRLSSVIGVVRYRFWPPSRFGVVR